MAALQPAGPLPRMITFACWPWRTFQDFGNGRSDIGSMAGKVKRAAKRPSFKGIFRLAAGPSGQAG